MSILKDMQNKKKFQAREPEPDWGNGEFTLSEALSDVIKPRDYVLPGLPTSKVGILAADGGVGKSFWALQSTLQVAAGALFDFKLAGSEQDFDNPDPAKIGSVLYVSLEDARYDIVERMQLIAGYWFENDRDLHEFMVSELSESRFIQILGLGGKGVKFFDDDKTTTPHFKKLQKKCRELPNLRYVVIDTLSRTSDADENDNTVMGAQMRDFEKLAEDHKCAVLILHHENKSGRGDKDIGSGAVRGASSIVFNTRCTLRMQKMTIEDAKLRGVQDEDRDNWIRFTNEKVNFGKKPLEKWLRRTDTGVLVTGTPPPPQDKPLSSVKERF